MSDYGETLRRHARLVILRSLEAAPRYRSNASMLATFLGAFGIAFTRDQVATEIAWLEEQGLVASEDAGGGVVIATATLRGVEIAQGLARHPDIQRPRPGV